MSVRLYTVSGKDCITPRELMDQLETPGLPSTAHYFITANNKTEAAALLRGIGKKVPVSRVLAFGTGETRALGAGPAADAMAKKGMLSEPGRIFITTLGEREYDVIVQLFAPGPQDIGCTARYRKVARFLDGRGVLDVAVSVLD